jgi:SprA-related family
MFVQYRPIMTSNPFAGSSSVPNVNAQAQAGSASPCAAEATNPGALRPDAPRANIAEPPKIEAKFGEWKSQGATREQALEGLRKESYAHILGHEQAHAQAAGSLGGSIVIEFNGDGIAVAGHVPVHFGFDPSNPESSLKNAQTVKAAAMAPGDPSAGDFAVAAKAEAYMGMAQMLIQERARKQVAAGASGV